MEKYTTGGCGETLDLDAALLDDFCGLLRGEALELRLFRAGHGNGV